jgi:hypothetical protein
MSPDTPLINEQLWRPLVARKAHQRAFLVQPGSTTPAAELSNTWNWHWPLLTSIRLLSLQPFYYHIDQSAANNVGDEPIVAATKDLRLVKIEASLQLQINPQTDIQILARINKHFINRVLRPLIRQSIRLTIANHPSSSILTTPHLDQQIAALLQPTLADQGLILIHVHVSSLMSFHPLIPNSPGQPS